MWYQATPQLKNPLSPRKAKEVDPNSHAHSPRHGTGKRRPIMTPTSISDASSIHRGLGIASALKSATTSSHVRSQTHLNQKSVQLSDPFVGETGSLDGMPSSFSQWLEDYCKHPPSISDIAMRDRSNVSSSDHDQSMPDYSRPISPTSLQSIQMTDLSRPPSFISALSQAATNSCPLSLSNREGSRQVSDWEQSLAGFATKSNPQHLKDQNTVERTDAGDHDRKGSTPQSSRNEENFDSFFEEGLAAYSPGRAPANGTFAPANTRVSSAANTPPGTTRPSTAKEARESSYSGKPRVASITTREVIPPSIRPASEGSARTGKVSHIPAAGKYGAVFKPQADVKSRKEGRTANIELDVPPKHQQNLTRISPSSHDKGNTCEGNEAFSPPGDQKRRKTSNRLSQDALYGTQGSNENASLNKHFSLDNQISSPVKHNEIDDLTAEGIVTRSALGEVDENIV